MRFFTKNTLKRYSSVNLTHFWLEWRNWNWNSTKLEWRGIFFPNGTEFKQSRASLKSNLTWWGGFSSKRLFIEMAFHQSGIFIETAFHQSGISLKWLFIKAAFHQSVFSLKRLFIKAAFHWNDFSLKQFFIEKAFHQSGFSLNLV